ncbi:MAG TPA: TonB-dependent receptor [Blastocatellia bacterium]|jgi:hypothetical protein|nr:TonB-dependent receptor [Blastocatellia bacterium]
MKLKRIVPLALVSLVFVTAASAAVLSDVRGVVLDPKGDSVKDAKVTLRPKASESLRTEKTNDSGEFIFSGVASGEYIISVEAYGFAKAEQSVVVVSGSSPSLRFQLQVSLKENINVTAPPGVMGTETATPTTLVSKEQIQNTTGATRTGSAKAITSYVPGSYVIHNQLHVHGGHQVTWLIDGVPIPSTNGGVDVGTPFNLNDISYLEAQRGSYSVEYGDRTYGIFSIIPRTGFDSTRQVELSFLYGNFNLTDDFISFADHTDRFGYYASLHGMRTGYGLAAPTPEVLHDSAHGFGGLASLTFKRDQSNQFKLIGSFERDTFEVPNDREAQAAGIRDEARQKDAFVFFTWLRTVGPHFLLNVSPFYHFAGGDFEGGPNDKPIIPRHERSSHYVGAHVLASAVTRRHSLKMGLYAFAERDSTLFGIQTTDGSGVNLKQRVKTNGNLEAVFIGDQYKPFSWLGLIGGIRLTHFEGAITETAADPRVGATIRLPRLNWVFHGFYGRYYQEPPLSTVSGPLLDFVAESGFGILPLHGERDEEHQFGITLPVKKWWVDVVHYRTGVKNFFDHEALGSSNIFFPVTIERARIRGVDVSVKSPKIRDWLGVSMIYALQRIEGQGAITGGLTDFAPSSDFFFLDHDQRHTLTMGVYASLLWDIYLFEETHYGSGFTDVGGSDDHHDEEFRPAHLPEQRGQSHLPGHFRFDLTLGKKFRKNWNVSLNSWNITNSSYLLDNSPTLGGVHWVTPRQIWVEVRYRFNY